MDGFKRPRQRPMPTVVPKISNQPPRPPQPAPQLEKQILPPIDMKLDEAPMAPAPKRRKRWPYIVAGVIALFVVLLAIMYQWYQAQLQPANAQDSSLQRIEVKEGSSFGYVADRLEERGIIRSSFAFKLFANLEGKQDAIKAGTCNLSPAQSPREILTKITEGCHDFKSVTFYPGATLETSLYAKTKAVEDNKEFKDMSIRASLRAAGYSDDAITDAFGATYDSPLFADKPAGADYEGYIFGETYYIAVDATAKDALQAAFDHMYSIVKADDLEAKFKARGLTLYQGITLASIVERELDCEGKPTEERQARCYGYQQRIARVFYNRLAMDMSLGSDVTSIYASDKLNVPSSIDVDSPYNTRVHAGLTPGPIATPGKLALRAVANPTEGDDLYFLAGDDGLIYFATDEAGHQANIRNHCQLYCGDL